MTPIAALTISRPYKGGRRNGMNTPIACPNCADRVATFVICEECGTFTCQDCDLDFYYEQGFLIWGHDPECGLEPD